MLKQRQKFLLLFIQVLSLPVIGASAAHQPDWPHEQSALAPDPAVTFGRLDNGFRYAILPNAEPPDRVSLRILFEAGSLMETEDQRGLAHFIEHMAFNGTENFPAGEMIEYFQKLGMAFGADTNAYTTFDHTAYSVELPRNDEELLRDGLLLFRDYAGRIQMAPEEIEKERGVILAEKRARDSAGFRTMVAELEFVADGTRFAERLPIGVEEVLKEAGRERFMDYYERWYTADRMALVAVGNITPEELEPLIAEYFGDLPGVETPVPDPPLEVPERQGFFYKLHTEPEEPVTRVSIQNLRAEMLPDDTPERRFRNLARTFANSALNRRLEILAKEEGAPFLGATAYISAFLDTFHNAGLEVITRPEQWEGALAVGDQELRRALRFGFSQAEIDQVRANLLNSLEEAVRARDTRPSNGLADALVRSIAADTVFRSPEQNLELLRPWVEGMTPETAHEALKAGWSSPANYLFVAGNLELRDAEAQLAAALEASREAEVEPREEEETADFAYTDFGPAGRVRETHRVEDLDITQVVFENGVRLNVKRTDFQANQVSVTARFGGGGLSEPADHRGLAYLARRTFDAGGLEAHSADELERILAGKSVGVGFSVGADSFRLGGGTTPKDFELQLRLMAAKLTAPGYRPEALRLFRKGLDPLYQQLEQTHQGVLADEVDRLLHDGDPRFGFPERAALEALDLEDVRAWLEPALKRAYLEVSIVGDIAVDRAIAGVAATFGALPPRAEAPKPYKAARQVSFPDNREPVVFTYQSAIPKGVSLVTWPTDDMFDIDRTRRLGLLADILGDRLRKVVREELGEAYSPFAFNNSSDTYEGYGYLQSYIVGDPEKTAELSEIVSKLGTELYESGTEAEELERILQPRLASIKDTRRRNGYWLGSVLAGSTLYPQQLDWARTIESDYAAVTVEEINALAREFLSPEAALKITVVPEAVGTVSQAGASPHRSQTSCCMRGCRHWSGVGL